MYTDFGLNMQQFLCVNENQKELDNSSAAIFLWQHRTIWQEHSAKDFASYESYKRAGILYVFPPFITARMGQKIGRRPQTQLCGDALYILALKTTNHGMKIIFSF